MLDVGMRLSCVCFSVLLLNGNSAFSKFDETRRIFLVISQQNDATDFYDVYKNLSRNAKKRLGSTEI